jgi:integral membrane protein (TIGR01906 family)
MPNRSVQVSQYIITLILPILIIGGIVRLLATDAYLRYEYARDTFPADSFGFSAQERFELASKGVHYVRAHAPEYALALQTMEGAPVYSAREVEHMADVRAVLQAILRAWQIAFVIFILLSIRLLRQREWTTLAMALQRGGIVTSALVLSIALLALFAWQVWFDLFHRFFFEAGSWLFSFSDTLIRLFPLQFWSDATFTITLLSLAVGLFTALVGRLWLIALDKGPEGIV